MSTKKPIKSKPPDYKCIKLTLAKLLHVTPGCKPIENTYNGLNIVDTINDAVLRTNKIVSKAYMLLRYWVLTEYETKNLIPLITTNTIRLAFNAVCKAAT